MGWKTGRRCDRRGEGGRAEGEGIEDGVGVEEGKGKGRYNCLMVVS